MEKTVISRRSFMKGTGAAVAGGVLGYGSKVLADPAPDMATLPYALGATIADAAALTKAKQKAVDGYMGGNCCYGAALGMIEGIKLGAGRSAEWARFPVGVFKYGGGGVSAWGTTCGAINAAAAVIAMAVGPNADGKLTDAGKVIDNLFAWYQVTEFPISADPDIDTYISATYTTEWHDFDTIAADKRTTISHSPLCHASVSAWCQESGKAVGSKAKKVRCAALTASVAAKALELIEAYKADTAGYKSVFATAYDALPANNFMTLETNDCYDCHGNGSEDKAVAMQGKIYGDAQGKMACEMCHDMPEGDTNNMAPKCTSTQAGVSK